MARNNKVISINEKQINDSVERAILEAKAIKKAALKNAELMLAEEFRPRLQSALSRRLSEELEDEDMPMDDEMPSDEEIPMEGEDCEDDEMPMEGDESEFPAEDEEEISIDEKIARIRKEMEGEEDEDAIPAEEPVTERARVRRLRERIARIREEEGDMEFPEEEPEEEELPMESARTRRINEARKLRLAKKLRESRKVRNEEEEEFDWEAKAAEAEDEAEEVKSENIKLRKKLREVAEVVAMQRKQMNEIGLLNSQLLYTNKLFHKYSLTEDQKRKIVNTIDNAKTIREAKTIFTAFDESFASANVRQKRTQRLSESRSSSVIGSTRKKLNESVGDKDTVIDGADNQYSRWQFLAGVKK